MKNLLDVWRRERFNPWREMIALQRQMDRLFDNVTRSEPMVQSRSDVDFVPACDVEETDTHYLLTLDIPGMTKDQIQLEITGNTLTISGEKKEEKKEGKGASQIYERFQGSFERSFTLPDLSASDKVEAQYQDGVLRISIPKSEEARTKTRKIAIGESKIPSFGKPQAVTDRNREKKVG